MLSNTYLLVPVCVEGNGTGHLRRMISLYNDLKKSFTVSIFISIKEIPDVYKKLLNDSVEQKDIYSYSLPKNKHWDFIVVDYKDSPFKLINNLSLKGFLIGIDEGGTSRGKFNYLIDIIPSLGSPVKPNVSSAGLMELPMRRSYSSTFLHKKILISFGGEDPKNLTIALLEFFNKYNYFPGSDITVVSNIKINSDSYSQSVSKITSIKNLKNILKDFDLIFTSFGLTAFESLASGVPFVLLNPSSYHKNLSKKCGFMEIGIEKPNKNKLDQFVSSGFDYKTLQKKYIPNSYTKLKDLILSINKTESICPVCKNNCNPANISHRFESKNFYLCSNCHMTFQHNYLPVKDSYKKKYFFEDYKKQYGRTYLEDFKSIQKFASGRLKIINNILVNRGLDGHDPELLDVGCAYGPFLAESSLSGYMPTGVEIIPEASEYVRSELGFQVLTSSFNNAVIEKEFDVVSMWYVIEHFENTGDILVKVNSILKPGGVFAFSTPNSSGISARKQMTKFLDKSPTDHITIWNPEISINILKQYGFKIKKIRVTGHHPERFPGFSRIKSTLGYKILILVSRLFKLGDTFEVYAIKIREPNV